MIFKKFKKTTSSQRNLIKLKKKVQKFPLLKFKTKGKIISLGKNSQGNITMYHKGGGHKRKYRQIDFVRKSNSISIVISIEYDPNRSSFIAALYDKDLKTYSYILAPKNLKIGDIVKSGDFSELKLGNNLLISKILVGSYIYNVSTRQNQRGIIARSAGTSALLIKKTNKYCKLLISSNKKSIVISSKSRASIGMVSNTNHFLETVGKAGRSRWLNRRPFVRGVAMNPIDHPHGGGEGKTSGGKSSVTPWGKSCKGRKTSRSKQILI